MKLKEVSFTSDQLENLMEYGSDFSDTEEKIFVLELNSWDVDDMNQSLNKFKDTYGSVLGLTELFDKFLITYISEKHSDKMYDLFDSDYEGFSRNFVGFTAVRESTRIKLLKFLCRFNYYNRMIKEECYIEEVNKCFFRVENCW